MQVLAWRRRRGSAHFVTQLLSQSMTKRRARTKSLFSSVLRKMIMDEGVQCLYRGSTCSEVGGYGNQRECSSENVRALRKDTNLVRRILFNPCSPERQECKTPKTRWCMVQHHVWLEGGRQAADGADAQRSFGGDSLQRQGFP